MARLVEMLGASMRPAQKAPENPHRVLRRALHHLRASMRPAQKAPENLAGNPSIRIATASFNEAGAKSAGKPPIPIDHLPALGRASMRPAQKAPENSAAVRLIGVAFVRFNEAGAKSAGKQRGVSGLQRRAMGLQ